MIVGAGAEAGRSFRKGPTQDGGSDQDGNGGEDTLEGGPPDVLKVEPTGFPVRRERGNGREKAAKVDPKDLALRPRKSGDASAETGRWQPALVLEGWSGVHGGMCGV